MEWDELVSEENSCIPLKSSLKMAMTDDLRPQKLTLVIFVYDHNSNINKIGKAFGTVSLILKFRPIV